MKRSAQSRGSVPDGFEDLRGKVLTVPEVATYLHAHSSTIYRMLRKRQLPAFRVGGGWRFTVDQIDRWLAEAEATGGAPAVSSEPKSAK